MTISHRLRFGPLAAIIFFVGLIGLGLLVPGYNPIHQTVSEIGEMDSPMRIPFAVMNCCAAACIVIFAWALRDFSRNAGRSTIPAWLTGCMAISAAGAGIFAYPHPLHNYFGISELVAYQAPIALALAWRREPRARTVVVFSSIFAVLMWMAIAPNLSTLDRHGELWMFLRPFYGLVQRALFVVWFGWLAGTGVLLARLGSTQYSPLPLRERGAGLPT